MRRKRETFSYEKLTATTAALIACTVLVQTVNVPCAWAQPPGNGAPVSVSPASGPTPDNQNPDSQSSENQTFPSADSLYYSQPDTGTVKPMTVSKPLLQALITIEKNLDPFQLDAESTKQVSLADVVDTALQNNLNIQIAQCDRDTSRWKLLNSYTKFLPNFKGSYLYDHIQGHIRTPIPGLSTGGPARIDSPFILAQAGIQYNAFQGGKILFGALQSRNSYRASQWKYRATNNDVLMESAKRYYNLLLSEAILEIRIRAVETSVEQLRLDTELETDGMATHLDVLQARTQLADDRQALIDQQIARRNAAIQLADYLNANQGIDLQPVDTVIEPVRLIAESVSAGRLLNLAAEHRPELKAFREQALAARKGIMIAAAPLYPTVQLNASEAGIGETLSNRHRLVVSPGFGGQPTTVARESRQITGLGVIGLTANWYLDAFGLTDFTNIQSARVQARQALLQSNQEVNAVISQVRQSYLNQLSALRRSEESQARVESSAEELRLSQLRLRSGLGKNIDILRAQQDLTNARVQHAQSTIEFDIAQAQLLHDVGVISRENVIRLTNVGQD